MPPASVSCLAQAARPRKGGGSRRFPMLLVPRARFAPSLRWLVRTSDAVVGPVPTDLLVRDERSLEWRRLEQVRELSSETGLSASGQVSRAAADLAEARDEGEVFLF